MTIKAAFTASPDQRTNHPQSLLGSISASLNLPVEDGAAMLADVAFRAIKAQMESRWPVLDFHMARTALVTDPLAHEAAALIGTEANGPMLTPVMVLARSVVMTAVEIGASRALTMLKTYAEAMHPDYADLPDLRRKALEPFLDGVPSPVRAAMVDFRDLDQALARLIGVEKAALRQDLDLGKSTVRDLLNGDMAWDERPRAWLIDRVMDRAADLDRIVCEDEFFVQKAKPALVGLAWQLYPERQRWLETHSMWIQVTEFRNENAVGRMHDASYNDLE